jgi:hypothetical protein
MSRRFSLRAGNLGDFYATWKAGESDEGREAATAGRTTWKMVNLGEDLSKCVGDKYCQEETLFALSGGTRVETTG